MLESLEQQNVTESEYDDEGTEHEDANAELNLGDEFGRCMISTQDDRASPSVTHDTISGNIHHWLQAADDNGALSGFEKVVGCEESIGPFVADLRKIVNHTHGEAGQDSGRGIRAERSRHITTVEIASDFCLDYANAFAWTGM